MRFMVWSNSLLIEEFGPVVVLWQAKGVYIVESIKKFRLKE